MEKMATTARKQSATASRRRLSADDRRRVLVEATISVLAEHGPGDASLRLVCKKAGVSPGLVSHFFDGWNDLLRAAYQFLADRYLDLMTAAVTAQDITPTRRIAAVLETYFSDAWVSEETGNAYVSLWALSRASTDLRSPMTVHYGEMCTLLAHAIHEVDRTEMPWDDAMDRADAFLIFLNGVWMEMILNPDNLHRDRAMSLGRQWVGAFLGITDWEDEG